MIISTNLIGQMEFDSLPPEEIDPDLLEAIELSKQCADETNDTSNSTQTPQESGSNKPPTPKSRPKNICGYVVYTQDGEIDKECRAKLNLATQLTGKCRCGNAYCSKHKLNHNCTFDYHKMTQKILEKNHPKVVGDKINRI